MATKPDVHMIRNEMDAMRAELRGEMAELRGELRADMAELRTDMADGFASVQRWTVTTVIGMTGLFGVIAFGAAHLGR